LLGAFSITRRCFRHYTRWFQHITVPVLIYAVLSPLYAVLSPFIYAVHLQLYAVVRALYAVLLTLYAITDAFIQDYFHILSMTCILFNDCLNLVCGWHMLFASGLQWQWHVLKRFIYALCDSNKSVYI
jgi:hypothetical protein